MGNYMYCFPLAARHSFEALHCISEKLKIFIECGWYVIVVSYSGFLGSDGDRGGTVVKVLCCKSEGRWFDPSWCRWNFSLA